MTTIERITEYWNARPCNVRHSTAPLTSREYMIETELRKYKVEPHIPGFAEFEKWTNKRVLEIGCGIGIDTANFVRWGADVTAIDLSQKSLDIADNRVHLLPWTFSGSPHLPMFRFLGNKARFLRANAEDLKASFSLSAYYDLIYAFGSIHHSPNPEAIVSNASLLLKRGGTLKIMVYNKYSWKSLWVLLKYGHGKFWKFRELIAKYSEAQTGCPVTHVYSPRELRAMLERNGFIVRKMYKDHIFKFEIEAYKQYRYEKTWYWKFVPAPVFRWLEKHFGWHLMAECTV
jgi:SAM-dependent methyltransferase